MKKLIALLLAAVMLLSFTACGGNGTEKTTENDKGFKAVSKTLGDFEVSVIAVEEIIDIEDNPAIRLYYDFTNNSDKTEYAFSVLSFTVLQDGTEMESTVSHVVDDVPETYNDGLNVRPGVTIRCIEEFNYDPDGGEIEIEVEEFWSEETLNVKLTSDMFNGRPAKDLEIKKISDPQWTKDLDRFGEYADVYFITIGDVEVFDNNGEQALRVFYEFTNNSEEEKTPWSVAAPVAYQDGVQLDTAFVWDLTTEDEALNNIVEPGETVIAAQCFKLRTDSPVEVELYDFWTESKLGTVFELD